MRGACVCPAVPGNSSRLTVGCPAVGCRYVMVVVVGVALVRCPRLPAGVPAWQAAAAVLLRSLAGREARSLPPHHHHHHQQPAPPSSSSSSSSSSSPSSAAAAAAVLSSWVRAHSEELLEAGVALLEAGAHFN
ncbi:hypothetical protein Agub_g4040, partial [Astrephomene gubernaculifera]